MTKIRFKIVFWSYDLNTFVTHYVDCLSFTFACDFAYDYLTRNDDCYIVGVIEANEQDNEVWKDEEIVI